LEFIPNWKPDQGKRRKVKGEGRIVGKIEASRISETALQSGGGC
jgi:hypothetical protein